jgi:hypothetical protein
VRFETGRQLEGRLGAGVHGDRKGETIVHFPVHTLGYSPASASGPLTPTDAEHTREALTRAFECRWKPGGAWSRMEHLPAQVDGVCEQAAQGDADHKTFLARALETEWRWRYQHSVERAASNRRAYRG